MMKAISPETDQLNKRLGDAFYEAQLVADQVQDVSGNQYLGSFANKGDQYQWLMDNAFDASGNPVYQRINPDGSKGGYCSVNADGKQVDAVSPNGPSNVQANREHGVEAQKQSEAEVRAENPDKKVLTEPRIYDCQGNFCKPDIVLFDPLTKQVKAIEVKTGSGGLTPQQKAIFEKVSDNPPTYRLPPDAIPNKDLALELDITPGRPLSDRYPDGIPIEIEVLPGIND